MWSQVAVSDCAADEGGVILAAWRKREADSEQRQTKYIFIHIPIASNF